MKDVRSQAIVESEPAPSPDMLSAELAPLCSMQVHATSACFNMSWLASLLRTETITSSVLRIGDDKRVESKGSVYLVSS